MKGYRAEGVKGYETEVSQAERHSHKGVRTPYSHTSSPSTLPPSDPAGAGGRDIDGTTRGLGGTPGLPVTSCGEENITMVDDSRYPMENILIHEMGHTVMWV